MKNALILASFFAIATCLSGCGASADSLVKKQIAQMNEMADAIEAGKSEEEVKAIQERMQATGKKLDDLDLSEEEKKKVLEPHKEEFAKAFQRLMTASMGKAFQKMGKGFPGVPQGGGLPNVSQPGGLPGGPQADE